MTETKSDPYLDSFEDLFRSGDPKADEKREEAANVRLVQNLISAIIQKDFAAVGEMLADDVKIEILGDTLPYEREVEGKTPMIESIRKNFSAVRNQKPRNRAVIAQGDSVIVIMEEEGEIQTSGEKYKIKGWQRFLFRDGKVQSVEEVFVPR